MEERMKDTCFKCYQKGHWAFRCPNMGMTSSPNKKKKLNGQFSPSSSTTTPRQSAWPARQCPCGAGPSLVRSSRTEKNPNRDFFVCPGKLGEKCNFFEWCDETNFDEKQDVTQIPYPKCPCGAGKCSLFSVKKEGPNKGKKFFVCPVKKGQGACKFFEWQEDTMRKAANDSHSEDTEHLTSFQETSDSQQETEARNADYTGDGNGNDNEVEKTLSPGSADTVGLNLDTDALLPRMRELTMCEKGQGECKFFEWQEDTMRKAANDSHSEDTEHLTSFQETSDSQQETEARNADYTGDGNGNDNEVEKTLSPGSADTVGLNLDTDALLPRMRELTMCEKGQGECKFFEWQEDTMRKAANDSHSEDTEHLTSFQETSDSQQETEARNADHTGDGNANGNDNEVEKTLSSGSAEIVGLNLDTELCSPV